MRPVLSGFPAGLTHPHAPVATPPGPAECPPRRPHSPPEVSTLLRQDGVAARPPATTPRHQACRAAGPERVRARLSAGGPRAALTCPPPPRPSRSARLLVHSASPRARTACGGLLSPGWVTGLRVSPLVKGKDKGCGLRAGGGEVSSCTSFRSNAAAWGETALPGLEVAMQPACHRPPCPAHARGQGPYALLSELGVHPLPQGTSGWPRGAWGRVRPEAGLACPVN